MSGLCAERGKFSNIIIIRAIQSSDIERLGLLNHITVDAGC